MIHEACPEGGEGIGEEVGMDAFVRDLSDKRIALSVRDKNPTQLSVAVKLAQTIYGNQRVLENQSGRKCLRMKRIVRDICLSVL